MNALNLSKDDRIYCRAEYGERLDGTIWMSLGDPKKGPHEQFEFYGSAHVAEFICRAVEAFGRHDETPSEYDRLCGKDR